MAAFLLVTKRSITNALSVNEPTGAGKRLNWRMMMNEFETQYEKAYQDLKVAEQAIGAAQSEYRRVLMKIKFVHGNTQLDEMLHRIEYEAA